MRGIARTWHTSNGGFYSYRFTCCRTWRRPLAVGTCVTRTLVKPTADRHVDLSGPITAIQTVWDAATRDRTWRLTTCSFKDELKLSPQAYKRFPSAAEEKWGDWEQACEEGEIATRVDSVWGYRNLDRSLFLTCAKPKAKKDAVICSSIRYRWPEGIARDPQPPRSWMIEGCGGQEALVEIRSSVVRGVRRWVFGCCELSTPSLDESTCEWRQVSGRNTADWSLAIGTHHVLRGINAYYDRKQNDRTAVWFEVCSFDGYRKPKPNVTHACETNQIISGVDLSIQEGHTGPRNLTIHCRDLPRPIAGAKSSAVKCERVDSEQKGKGPHIAQCGNNSIATAIIWSEKGGYSLDCCSREGLRLVSQTCHQVLPGGPESFNWKLPPGKVLTALAYSPDVVEEIGSWTFTVCRTRAESTLSEEAYAAFPSGARHQFGQKRSTGNVYGKECGADEVITRIDSVWGEENNDRGYWITCGKRGARKLALRQTRVVYPEGKEGRAEEAGHWDGSGCHSQEVLYSLHTWLHQQESPRRLKFGCRELYEYPVDEHSCYWKATASEFATDWVLKVPEDETIRGVRASFHPLHGDRKLELELCRLKSEWRVQREEASGSCSVALARKTPLRVRSLSFDFSHQDSLAACVARCAALPLACGSVRYSGKGHCHLTPVQATRQCRSAQLKNHVGHIEWDKEIWVYCFKCQPKPEHEQLLEES